MKGIRCQPDEHKLDELEDAAVDITAPRIVEVLFDSTKSRLWVNINGVCVVRACRIDELIVGGM